MRSLRHRLRDCVSLLLVLHVTLWCNTISFTTQAIPSRAALGATADTLEVIRAIHIGGNFGRNPIGIAAQPQDYYDFLRDLKVNWIGIVVGLQVMSSIDSTLERVYNVPLPTFEDNVLIDAIRGFKERGYKVYICLAIETQTAAQSQYPVHGHQLGDPYAPSTDPAILPEYWPWDPAHPNHQQFVDCFWRSYTNEAVHFATIAQQEGVDLFAIGAERDRLFRTRSGGVGPNNFRDQIQAMVDSVRSVYSGLVTYEMHWSALVDPGYFGPGSDHLWEDVGLDVVGVSAYFQLADPPPTSVLAVAQLEASWQNVFTSFLIPLQNRNPNLPVVFLEFGYVDVVASPYYADSDAFKERIFKDKDGNGLDDGEETQANAYEAFFNVNEQHNNLVRGAFLFGNDITSDSDWEQTFGQMRTLAIRNKLAEDVVKTHYTSYLSVPSPPILLSPPNGSEQVSVSPILQWQDDLDADTYRVQVSDALSFATILADTSGIAGTSCVIPDLECETTFYWRTQATNAKGTSSYSDAWSFTTVAAIPTAPLLSSPANGETGISLQPTLSWVASPGAVTYHLQVSNQSDFSLPVVDDSLLTTTSRQVGPLKDNRVHYWRVSAKNTSGRSAWSEGFSFTTQAASGLQEDDALVIREYRLLPSYPNPFNPATTISYQIPHAGRVRLRVYSTLGVEIATLVNQDQQPGYYNVKFDGGTLPSGIYVVWLHAGSFVASQKLILLR
jgi:hypothetical protein